MGTNGYIRAVGDSDYNFGYNDFCIEFFIESDGTTANGAQTLFEITNNNSPAANLYQKTRLITVLESNNLNTYALQTVDYISVLSNVGYFTSPVPVTSNIKFFYNSQLLNSNQFSASGSNISLTANINISAVNTQVEVAEILFSVNGTNVTSNVNHFISAERYQNHFYLYLDGVAQCIGVPAFQAIPCQELPWTGNTANVLNRTGNSALLTIGANRDGADPFFGEFGDFKITNGVARHVTLSEPQNIIKSSFTDTQLGKRSADITISGGGFVDSINSYAPEELVTAQIFDTTYITVYQSNIANTASNILAYSIFRPGILAGPYTSYTINITGANVYSVPWTHLNSSDAAVQINGNSQSTANWSISNNNLAINLGNVASGNIQIVTGGPTSYHTISANGVATLTSNMYSSSNIVTLSNVAGFITPIISPFGNTANVMLNTRGRIFINDECISYLYVDTVNNVLSGLQRGHAGTGIPAVHPANSQVINACYNRDLSFISGLDAGANVWYTTPFANTSLQNTHSVISNILVGYGTVPPATPQ